MPDHFYLSLWLRDFAEERMLDHFRVLLEAFPYSAERPGIQSIRVYPFDWSEHPVLEEDFFEGATAPHVIELASEFLHGDYAYESTAYWDLWLFQKNGGPASWKRAPCRASLICHGPEFDEAAQHGHLEVDFGLDTPFRADQKVPDEVARNAVRDYRQRLQDNMRKLLEFAKVAESRLPVVKRLLWSETGENFAELVRRSFE